MQRNTDKTIVVTKDITIDEILAVLQALLTEVKLLRDAGETSLTRPDRQSLSPRRQSEVTLPSIGSYWTWATTGGTLDLAEPLHGNGEDATANDALINYRYLTKWDF